MTSFSVVITTKNRNSLCYRALHSVINQKKMVREVVIIDDFSDIPFQPNFDLNYGFTLIVLRNETSLGTSASRNLGVKNCTSDYILFLDDDDVFINTKVEVLNEKMTGNEDIIYHDFFSCYPDFGIIVPVKKYTFNNDLDNKLINQASLYNFMGGIPTICVKRIFFHNVGGFDESLSALEDWEFNIRMLRFKPIILHVNIPLTCCNYILNRKSVSSALKNNFRAYYLIEKKIRNIDGLLNRLRRCSCFYSTIGSSMRLRNKVLLSFIFYFISIVVYPNFRCILLFFSSFVSIKLTLKLRKSLFTS